MTAVIITPDDGAPSPVLPAGSVTLFVVGAAPGSNDWTGTLTAAVEDLDDLVVVMNPHGATSPEHLNWEYQWLNRVDLAVFWFPAFADRPESLIELGMTLAASRSVLVGCAPDFLHRDAVRGLCRLTRETPVADDLIALSRSFRRWVAGEQLRREHQNIIAAAVHPTNTSFPRRSRT